MKRSRHRIPDKAASRAIVIYFPQKLIKLLDQAVSKSKGNLNQFICVAIREKMEPREHE